LPSCECAIEPEAPGGFDCLAGISYRITDLVMKIFLFLTPNTTSLMYPGLRPGRHILYISQCNSGTFDAI
jgi:hypothetical protein